jgi:hypothetical protein
MPKKFTFNYSCIYRAAVHGDKGFVASRTLSMRGSCNKLFSRAGLPDNKNRGIYDGSTLDKSHFLAHNRARIDHLAGNQ